MKGRFQPSEPTDQECEHCGLWFTNRGILNHEEHCEFAGRDYRVTRVEPAQ